MNKLHTTLLINLVVIFLLVGCHQKESILPPTNDNEISLKTGGLISYNSKSTSYSLGEIDSTYIFSKDSFTVKSADDEQTYAITYNPQELDKQAFEKSLQALSSNDTPDISNYKNCLQYDLCSATTTTPGYRLYVLDDTYWMGILYQDSLWRCVSLKLIQ